MEIAGVVERVERVASVRANPAADTALIQTGLVAVREVQAWCDAVVVRNGVVLYAPGEPNLGRNTRLANQAQRRALRGLYRSCAIPGGTTDLNNLLPVCGMHHTRIHNDGWIIELGPHRVLTLRLPDGTIHTTGPPTRQTAA